MEPIFEKFPEFRKAYDERIEVHVYAGDSIYIPPYVWHYVETDEFCEYFLPSISFLITLSALAVNFAGSANQDRCQDISLKQMFNLHNILHLNLLCLPPKNVAHFLQTLENIYFCNT
jgi:ribosomal protein L16 Arg81 hydroxylase